MARIGLEEGDLLLLLMLLLGSVEVLEGGELISRQISSFRSVKRYLSFG